MKIRFDTSSGVDTRLWECLLAVSCTPDDETPEDLLEAGWLLDPVTNDWYMSRSVRIDLSKWQPKVSEVKCVASYDWRALEEVSSLDRAILRMYREERGIIDYPYDAFSRHGTLHAEKGFSKEGDCWYMTTHFTNAALYPICAFQKDGTRTSPGKACWARACQVSKARGASHLYVYEGYGLANQYKANSEGFEWWDGSRWSGDKGLYLEATRDDHRPHPKIPAGIDS
jgi:hypothetical protein